jgi:hypothetical protein
VTRWPRRLPSAPIEPPSWVRVFDPAAWDEPDDQERLMATGSGFGDEHRRWHAERRWVTAVNEWYRQHPEADDRLEQRRERIARQRGAGGWPA